MKDATKILREDSPETIYMHVNILGYNVEVHRWNRTSKLAMSFGEKENILYNAYVEIPNSKYLKQSYVGYDATWREDDVLGVDTMENWLENKPEHVKLRYALDKITRIIQRCVDVLEPEDE